MLLPFVGQTSLFLLSAVGFFLHLFYHQDEEEIMRQMSKLASPRLFLKSWCLDLFLGFWFLFCFFFAGFHYFIYLSWIS